MSEAPFPQPVHTGKVRDLYTPQHSHQLYPAGPGELVMVASDRVSAFDVVLNSEVPDKGIILTQLSLWWFKQLGDLVPNHVISGDVRRYPPPFDQRQDWRGRSMHIQQLDMVMVECVGRAYLSGSAFAEYRRSGSVCGIELPDGLVEGSELPEPIFTPTTKGGGTGHDEPLSFNELSNELGADLASRLRDLTLAILEHGRKVCEPRGIILADTKVEFGHHPLTNDLVLGDEILTPDSSRFWDAAGYEPGGSQPSYDKQPLRDWLETTGWDKRPPGPDLPAEVVAETRQRYVTAFETITGIDWAAIALSVGASRT
jgi:phosphoribosylaminoimidazole-succinocarboxamide synthase